jgi:rod shape-determining protein MreB and related proteins
MTGSFFISGRTSIGIDIGNSNTKLANTASDTVAQPSFIALGEKNSIKAVGKAAFDMAGRASSGFKVVKPLKGGVIIDYESAKKMLQGLVNTHYPNKALFGRFNNIIASVPYASTEVERRALRDILQQFSSSRTFLIYEPLAAALGIGLDIQSPQGCCIVDIGGGITEVVVISLSGIVVCNSVRMGGDTFDEAIQEYVRHTYAVEISQGLAETAKIKAGAAWSQLTNHPEPFELSGSSYTSGTPTRFSLNYKEISTALERSISTIEETIMETLEQCPPELSGDIYKNGIHLTGGGSLLRGLRERLETKTKVRVHQDPNALLSVTKGISTVLNHMEKYKYLLMK